MDYKFITPVGMQVTKKQFETDLKQQLVALGYNLSIVGNFNSFPYLKTNFGLQENNIDISQHNIMSDNGYFIDHYNPELFLALAAMTDNPDGIKGEWWKCVEGEISYTKDKLYCQRQNKPDRWNNLATTFDNYNSTTNGLSYKCFVKATKEEIIKHLSQRSTTTTSGTSSRDKKIKEATLIGYRLIKPEYAKAACTIAGYKSFGESIRNGEIIHTNTHARIEDFGKLDKAKVLDKWFEPVYKPLEAIWRMGGENGFDLIIRDKKVYHKNEDITRFVEKITGLETSYKEEGYTILVKDVIFEKTGCENKETRLSEWIKLANEIK